MAAGYFGCILSVQDYGLVLWYILVGEMNHYVLCCELCLKLVDIDVGNTYVIANSESYCLTDCLTCDYCGRNYTKEIPGIAVTRRASAGGHHIRIVTAAKGTEGHFPEIISVLEIVDSTDRIVKVLIYVINPE